MGLFDIVEGLMGGGQTPQGGNLIGTVMQVLNAHPGGLDGVLQSLRGAGLGDAVNSWVGTGPNAAVSGDQLQNVLGSGIVQQLATKLGISPTDAASHLSNLLPGIVDHLTPNGEVPQGGLAGAGMDLLKGLLSRNAGASQ